MIGQFLFFILVGGIDYNFSTGHSRVMAAGNRVPRIMMLQRQIRNYVPGSRATITVVYEASVPLTIRWFRQTSVGPRPYSEIPDMLPALGDPRLDNSSIYEGNMVATTLVIRQVDMDPFPAKYTLVLSGIRHPVGYELDTIIEAETRNHNETLKAMYWTGSPDPLVTLGQGGELQVRCTARLRGESSGFTDELIMYREILEKPTPYKKWPRLRSNAVVSIHKDTSNFRYHDEVAKGIYMGNRIPYKYGYAEYKVGFEVDHTTDKYLGAYTCEMERVHDRMFTSSWIQLGPNHTAPIIGFVPCEENQVNEQTDTVTLSMAENKESCFRCLGYGYPYASMTVLKDGLPMVPSSSLLIDTYLSVDYGALSEISVTVLHPTSLDSGKYECRARNEAGEVNYKFSLSIAK